MRGEQFPSAWNWHLATTFAGQPDPVTPAFLKTITTLSQATQSSGGGYDSNGYPLVQNSTDFPVWDWYDDVAQIGSFTGGYLQTKQLELTAAVSDIAWQFWLLCDNNDGFAGQGASVTDREVYLIGNAGATQTILATKTAFIDNEMRLEV